MVIHMVFKKTNKHLDKITPLGQWKLQTELAVTMPVSCMDEMIGGMDSLCPKTHPISRLTHATAAIFWHSGPKDVKQYTKTVNPAGNNRMWPEMSMIIQKCRFSKLLATLYQLHHHKSLDFTGVSVPQTYSTVTENRTWPSLSIWNGHLCKRRMEREW